MSTKLVASPGSSYSPQTSETIRELLFETSELTSEAQLLLDYQATQLLGKSGENNIAKGKGSSRTNALEENNHGHGREITDISKIRRHIRKTMAKLEVSTAALCDTLRREAYAQSSVVSQLERNINKSAKLQKKVRYITQESEDAKNLQAVLTREQDVNVCIYLFILYIFIFIFLIFQ